jgi:hypothetical protein
VPKLLGNITIGDNCRVGAGSVVLRNVPPNSTIVGVPGHIVLRDGKRVVITDPKDIRDPLSDVIIKLATEVHELRERFQQHTHEVLGAEPCLTIDEETSTPNISPQELFQDDYQDSDLKNPMASRDCHYCLSPIQLSETTRELPGL